MSTKTIEAPPPCKFLPCDGRFEDRGRGVPLDKNGDTKAGSKMVKVCIGLADNGATTDRMVSESEWLARLPWRCPHGKMGWACKECLTPPVNADQGS